jgi:hypothetical protein
MKNKPKRRPLFPAIKHLLVPAKGTNMHKLYPKEYYRPVWFDKLTFENIDFIRQMQHVTKKEAVHQLIQAGFKVYIEEKFRQHIQSKVVQNEQVKRNYPDRFVRLFRCYAKDHGIDISKIL